MQEPIDYEQALKDLRQQQARRRILRGWKRVLDPRPTSPGQVMLVGVSLIAGGWLLPFAHVALTVGLALLVLGFISGMLQPRGRQVTWRNRRIDLPPPDSWTSRLYYVIYRRE